nr:MAG TPA: hypothetical protein [Caudoviricetes sp.]
MRVTRNVNLLPCKRMDTGVIHTGGNSLLIFTVFHSVYF